MRVTPGFPATRGKCSKWIIRGRREGGTTICSAPSSGAFRTRMPASLSSNNEYASRDEMRVRHQGSAACSRQISSSFNARGRNSSTWAGAARTSSGEVTRSARPRCGKSYRIPASTPLLKTEVSPRRRGRRAVGKRGSSTIVLGAWAWRDAGRSA
jgi:hypothetical protein